VEVRVLISGAEVVESETGTAEAGDAEGLVAACGAGDSAPVDDCPLFEGRAGIADVSPAGVGETDGIDVD
jgi:hypothetical protein